jgi:hypothetical protein
MLKTLGTGKVTSLLMAAATTVVIVYRAVEQDMGAMVQRLVFDTAATEAYHQVQYGIT